MRKGVAAVLVCGSLAAAFFFWQEQGDPPPASNESSPARTRQSTRDAFVTGEVKKGTGAEAIRGLVYDAAGPIAGATLVAVRADEEEDLSQLSCDEACPNKAFECDAPEAAERVVEWVKTRRGEAPPVARTTSAADGTFELTHLTRGVHRVWALSEGRGVTVVEKVMTGALELDVPFGVPSPVSGKVVDAKDAPLPGIWVTAFIPGLPRYFDAQTGPDGRFAFESLPSHTEVSLVALGADGASTLVTLRRTMARSGMREGQTLVLAPPVERLVRVVADGKPAPGAVVSRVEGAHHRDWTTDGAGEVKVFLLREKSASLVATLGSLGGEADLLPHTVQSAKPIVIELLPASWVSGEVKDEEGRVMPGVKVTSGEGSVLTDAAGHYRLGPVSSRRQSTGVAAAAKGYVGVFRFLSVASQRELKADFTLVREQTASGRVLSPAGEPLEDAEVSGNQEGELQPHDTKSSAADGTFSLEGLTRGPCALSVVHPLWGTLRQDVTLPTAALELRFAAGSELEVTFVDDSGRPLQVSATLISDEPMTAGRAEPREGQTDRGGRVRFKGLSAGRYALVPREEGNSRTISTVELEERKDKALRVVLAEGLRIEGVVVDTAGNPVAEAYLEAQPHKEGPMLALLRPSAMLAESAQRSRATSDAQGRFQLRHLSAGSYRLSARGQLEFADKTVEAGAVGVELVLPAKRVVTGRVVDEQQRAVTHFRVGGDAFDSSTGEFKVSVGSLQPSLMIDAEDFPPHLEPLSKESGKPLTELGTIVLARARSVRVRVVDAETSRPIEGASVLGWSSAQRVDLVTDVEGVAVVEGLRAEESAVSVRADGYLFAREQVAPGVKEVVVALRRAARIAGQVVALDGGPGQAQLMLSSADGGAASGRTDDKGHYEVLAGAGTWDLRVDFGNGHLRLPPQQVSLATGQTLALDVQEPGGGVSFTVNFVDARGEAVMMMGTLVPGLVATPETFDAWRELTKRGERVMPNGRESVARPGEATLVALAPSSHSDELYVFTERVVLTSAPRQVFTVKVPPNLKKLERPKRGP